MTEDKLETIFIYAAQMPEGNCSFPEPGRSPDITIEHPTSTGLISRKSEKDTDKLEKKRFHRLVLESAGAEGMNEELIKQMLEL